MTWKQSKKGCFLSSALTFVQHCSPYTPLFHRTRMGACPALRIGGDVFSVNTSFHSWPMRELLRWRRVDMS